LLPWAFFEAAAEKSQQMVIVCENIRQFATDFYFCRKISI
jgi:hypothetical protein